jgi:radical SAM superfamily enzyme YgiQ (UPF0313 family)
MTLPETQQTDIALVNVPYGGGGQSMRPIGLSFIISYLRQNGLDAAALDLSNSVRDAEQLVSAFRLHEYRIVGLSFYNSNAALAYALARTIKALNPSCLVVAGGAHPSASDERMVQRHPYIDVVVRNEGELTFLELARRWLAGEPLSGTLGITHRVDGRIVHEEDRERVSDLDSLAAPVVEFTSDSDAEKALSFTEQPEPHLRRAGRTRNAVAMVTSRSCPYNCSFCAIILIGRKWRAATPAKVGADFMALDRAAGGTYEHIYFMDANFFVDVKRAIAIAEEIQRVKPGTTFSFSTRVNQINRAEDDIARLCQLGLRSIEIGIESASPAALKRFAKDVVPEQNDQAVSTLTRLGLQLGLDFIMFDAEASLDDLDHNIDFLERHNLDDYIPWDHVFNTLTPYLGTPIRSHYEKLRLRKFDDDVLPEPSSLLMRKEVRQIYQQLEPLKETLETASRAIERMDRRIEDSDWGPETARTALNSVALRRWYHTTLKRLVQAARRGDEPSLHDAMPPIWTEDRRQASFEEWLTYELR